MGAMRYGAHALRGLSLFPGLLLLAMAGPTFAADRELTNFASGVGTLQSVVATGTQTYRASIDASEYFDLRGVYESTHVSLQESTSSPSSWGYRVLGCTVPRSAFDSNQNTRRATLSALLDTSSPSCMTYGSICIGPTCALWNFSGFVAVTGYWHDARYTTTSSSQLQTTDNVTRITTRQSCNVATWDDALGGFSIGPNTYNFVPPGGSGRFQSVRCTNN